jgi:hypothetical protein
MMYTCCMSENTNDLLLAVAIISLFVLMAWRLRAQIRQPRAALFPLSDLSPSQEQIKNAYQAERAVNVFRIFTQRTNNILIGITALLLAGLTTLFMPESWQQWIIWFIVCIAILGSQTIALHYLHKWINYEERFLLKQVYQIEELILKKSGLSTSNESTGLYTREFVAHILELYTSRIVGRVLPVTCLVIEIVGLESMPKDKAEEIALQVMPELASVIVKRVRISDMVYQPAWNRLGVVLLRYPARSTDVIEKHLLIMCHSTLERYNSIHHWGLEVHWSGAILPIQARTPLHLLHIGEASLVASITASKESEVRQKRAKASEKVKQVVEK